ncbi:hypothetical protein C0Q70_21401 [Pomacea canaliculata]|uniref:Immunoglobulin domain-containing protein n=3 Tax=Pomacea canaliculata TaxID=400727 RepID=A0A2T7NCE4_POMCA|nr:uncharacterized protein LOC112555199 isoform X2 [Pomacea canaliculata]PVD18844.1 hypothetical protein C0Q70_21401 [Pomacea canaliculata]
MLQGLKRMEAEKVQLLSVIFTVLVMPWLAQQTAGTSFECHEKGYCSKYLPGPGPLNMNDYKNFSLENSAGSEEIIPRCAENFTSFQWYRIIDDTYLPFPWGREDGLQLCDNNQTLIINSVQKDDEGVYVFQVSNGTAHARGFLNYTVSCKSGKGQLITNEQPEQYIALGAQKTLQCAADFGDCGYHDGVVMWTVNKSDGHLQLVRNSTNRFIKCDTNGYNGKSCNLTFSKVSAEDFEVEYNCRLYTPQIPPDPANQYSVRLLQLYSVEESWLGYIIAVVLTCVLVGVAAVFTVRRYGECIKFWLRRQPHGDKWEHDVVVIHGEDHHSLVTNHVIPQLQKEGYAVAVDVVRLGRPEIIEQANAVVSAYSVIFFFSPDELCRGGPHFLTTLAQQTHSYGSIIVIRQEGKGHNQNLLSLASHPRQPVSEDLPLLKNDDSCMKKTWKNQEYGSFKQLTWPEIEISPENGQPLPCRKLDQFWYGVRNNLPKPRNKDKSVPPQNFPI